MERITRKEFFRLLLGRARPAEPVPAFEPQDPLWADFPDALLAEEVRRLGLDPQGLDRPAMLAAVRGAMLEQTTPRTAATQSEPPTVREAAEEAAAMKS